MKKTIIVNGIEFGVKVSDATKEDIKALYLEDQKQFGEDLEMNDIENVQLAFSTDVNFGKMDFYFDKVFDFEDMDGFISEVIENKDDITNIDFAVTVKGELIPAMTSDKPFDVEDIKEVNNNIEEDRECYLNSLIDTVIESNQLKYELESNLKASINIEFYKSTIADDYLVVALEEKGASKYTIDIKVLSETQIKILDIDTI